MEINIDEAIFEYLKSNLKVDVKLDKGYVTTTILLKKTIDEDEDDYGTEVFVEIDSDSFDVNDITFERKRDF